MEGLLLPSERHKTLTGLVNTEPVVGAQLPRVQTLQWFLSESDWDERQVQAERLKLLCKDPTTAPTAQGVLVIDETGDRKDGHKTAHVGRQYLGNLGKINNGVVSVTSLWADERVYYPLEVEPYTPESYFAKGKNDPHFRTKLKIALELVKQALQEDIPFRAMVADSFYGEDRGLKGGLRKLKVPYVMALKPSHAWWHPEDVAGTLQDVAREAGWVSAEQPGKWVRITRTFRDGGSQQWWALEIKAGPYGPDKTERAVVATTDPQKLPDPTTWYLVTNLPAPTQHVGSEPPFPPARLEEVIRLYGLRMWVEQSYKHIKHARLLVPVPGAQRQGDPTALATRLLRFLLLLVSSQPFLFLHDGRTAEAICAGRSPGRFCRRRGNGKKKSAREKTCGHRCPGRWHCERFADGWNPGSCCSATGAAGRHSPHLLPCNSCFVGLRRDMLSLCTVLLDPRPQTTDSETRHGLLFVRDGMANIARV